MLQPGTLIHRVTIQASTEVDDGHRGTTVTWDDTLRTRLAARVTPLMGRDLDRARQIDPRATHEVTLRYWREYPTDLDGGRARLVWHDGSTDRTLEIVEPPREVAPRVSLAMITKEAAA